MLQFSSNKIIQLQSFRCDFAHCIQLLPNCQNSDFFVILTQVAKSLRSSTKALQVNYSIARIWTATAEMGFKPLRESKTFLQILKNVKKRRRSSDSFYNKTIYLNYKYL